MKKTVLLIIILTLTLSVSYLPASGQYSGKTTNSKKFLPRPPTDTMTQQMVDNYIYFDVKTKLRQGERGEQVGIDMHYITDSVYKFASVPFGVEISSSSPANKVYKFIVNAHIAAEGADAVTKYVYYRRRPCSRFNENTYKLEPLSYFNKNDYYSYPSSHSKRGWALGSVLSIISHNRQDTLMERAYEYGQSRVIGGAHWQTDVDASRLLSAAGLACIFSDSIPRADLDLAKQQYNTLTGTPPAPSIDNIVDDVEGMKKILRFMPGPPYGENPITAYDASQYSLYVNSRDNERGRQALAESNPDWEVIFDSFSSYYGTTISPFDTPELWNLLTAVNQLCIKGCDWLSTQHNRIRPCVYFHSPAGSLESPESLEVTSSYPSAHSAIGWASALVLNAVNRTAADSVYRCGYEFGQSRVVAGTNWQSDVDAGRLVACAAFVRLASASDFVEKLSRAIAEDRRVRQQLVTEIDGIRPAAPAAQPLYTVDGRRATPESHGVLVGKDKKILVP